MSLPRYPKYKDSGVAWLGEVPEHWDMKPLWAFFRRIKRVGFSAEQLLSVYRDYGVVTKASRDDNFNKPSDDLSVYQLVTPGDLAINKMKAWQGSVAISEYRGIVSPAYFVYEAIHHANSRYLHYLMRSLRYITGYLSISKGIRINQWDLEPQLHSRMPIVVPPLAEQTAIAEFLDRETAKIDELVAEQRRLIELLKEKRQAVISHAVTRGLNPQAPLKPSGIEWLGDVPSHWEVGGMTKYLSSIVDYRGRTPTKVDEGVFLLTARNIRNGKLDYITSQEFILQTEYEDVMRRGKPELGDVVFTTEAPLGQVANIDRTDVALAQRVLKFRGQAGVLYNYFLKFWLLGSFAQADMEQLATGSTALGLKGSKVVQLRLCLPPHNEQIEIVKFLNTELAKLDTLTAEAQRAIDLLQERRSALISAAVTGQIDIRGMASASLSV